jgi:cytoskeletal protein RodZ
LIEEKKETVGQYLRKEREKRNVSLEAVAKVTRITRENLKALENDDFQVISAPVFVRGFLRNYASYLGLDPKEVIARYDSQTDLLPVPQDKEPPSPPPPREEKPIFKTLLFLSILLVGVVFSFYYYQKTSGPPSAPPPSAGVAPSPDPGIQPSPSKGTPGKGKTATRAIHPEKSKQPPDKLQAATTPLSDTDQAKEKRHVLRAVAMEKTWLRIVADDHQVSDVLLQPKEASTWTARRKFAVTIGNAGGVELFFNGTSQGRLGNSGAVVHLVLPKEMQPTQPAQELPAKEIPAPKDFKPAPPVSSPPSSKEGSLKETRFSPGDVSQKSKPSPETPSKETVPSESVPAPKNEPPGEGAEDLKKLR